MLLKINNKPLRVEEEEDRKDKIDAIVHISISTIAILCVFYVLDFAAYTFVGIHPFPMVSWVGGVLRWLGFI